MMCQRSDVIAFSLILFTFAATEMCVLAQPPSKVGAPQAGSSIPGDSRLPSGWLTAYPTDPRFPHERIVEYNAVETPFGSSQPIVLEPVLHGVVSVSLPSGWRPLTDNEKLVVKINDPNDLFEKYCTGVLNLNVASQAGTAESPASLRPTQSPSGGGGGGGGASAASVGTGGGGYTITSSAPCVPALTQIAVTVNGTSGAGVSPNVGAQVSFREKNVAGTPYVVAGVPYVQNVATDVNGMAVFMPLAPGTIAVTAIPVGAPMMPVGAAPGAPLPVGPPLPIVLTAQIQVYVPSPHIYFLPWNERLSPDTSITVSVTALTPALSQDQTGNTAQPITVMNQTFNHVHALNTFNISTGIIYSWLRNPTFTRQESSAAVTCQAGATGCTAEPEMYQTVTTQGSRTVDPALFFTIYAFGKFDAERKWHLSDLKPEPSVGLSLSSPTTDYFFGTQSEVWRGVQLVGGIHEGQRNQLVPPLANDPTSSTAPVTKLVFNQSGFIGITFNISFIQSLFSGAKGGS